MVVPFLTDALAALPCLCCPSPTLGGHVTPQTQTTRFCTKFREFLFTTARGKGRVHSRQQHSCSYSHPTPMGTQEPTPARGASLLRDQECPAHVALPKQPEAQDGCEVPGVLPSAGTSFLTTPSPHSTQARAAARMWLLHWHSPETQAGSPLLGPK